MIKNAYLITIININTQTSKVQVSIHISSALQVNTQIAEHDIDPYSCPKMSTSISENLKQAFIHFHPLSSPDIELLLTDKRYHSDIVPKK